MQRNPWPYITQRQEVGRQAHQRHNVEKQVEKLKDIISKLRNKEQLSQEDEEYLNQMDL